MAYVLGSQYQLVFDEIKEIYDSFTELKRIDFWRGFFDTNGVIHKYSSDKLMCCLTMSDVRFIELFKEFVSIPFEINNLECKFTGLNVIEFLHIIYKDVDKTQKDKHTRNYLVYMNLLYCWMVPSYMIADNNVFKFKKVIQDAREPKKAHVTDTGYDLWLIEKIKEENGMILYDTGIAVQPPLGYYFEVVGRSSISKSGYILANSVGIIDASYRGTIKVALIKINKDVPDLELPCRLVQLIPKHFIHLDAKEVSELDDTTRSEGGFGSSG